MVWTEILELLKTIGAGAATVGSAVGKGALEGGKFVGETLIGDLPRIGGGNTPGGGTPVSQFTGDLLGGLGNKNGLLGQAARVAMVASAFGKSPQMGLQVLGMLEGGDQADSLKKQKAAYENWTPEMFEERTGERYLGPVKAMDLAPGGPSAPNQVIDQQITPEVMEQAAIAEMKARRAQPSFGQGMSQEQLAAEGAQAQRQNLSTAYPENIAMYQDTLSKAVEGGFNPGLYKSSFGITPEGIRAQHTSLDAFDQSHSLDTIANMEVPDGYQKVVLPDEVNPGRAYVKVVNVKTGRDLYDIVQGAAAGDPQAKAEMDILNDFYAGRRAGTEKLGSLSEQVKRAAAEMGLKPEELTVGDVQILESAMNYKPSAMFQIEGSTVKAKSPGTMMDEAKAEVLKRHSSPEMEEVPKGPIEPSSLLEMSSGKKELGQRVTEDVRDPKRGPQKAQQALMKQLKLATGSKKEKMKVLAEILEETGLSPEEQTMIMIAIEEELL